MNRKQKLHNPDFRRTKIVATIGPATEKETTIEKLILAGANVFRFNLKYSPSSWHNDKISKIRKIAKKLNKNVGVLIDLPRSDFGKDITDWDFIALSYLKHAREVSELKDRLARQGKNNFVVAKIENQDAMDELEKIIDAADAIMVARGDLGKETPIEELAFFQKRIVDACRRKNRPVIVATEMLYSMTKNKTPTRAEATDVANAVFDGTDAVMLSEETALGSYPVEAVETMNRISTFCENTGELRKTEIPISNLTENLIESAANIARTSREVKAIVIFTKSGNSARQISRYRLNIPVIAVSNDKETVRRCSLSYGVTPYYREFSTGDYHIDDPVFDEIKNIGVAKEGDVAIVIHGQNWLKKGSTNQLSLRKF